jgi:hypothetical protein
MEEPRRMRKQDAWGKPILRQGDVVRSLHDTDIEPDMGTVTKIIQVNANGAYVVRVNWFQWRAAGNISSSEEYVEDLILMSEA